VRDSGAPTQKGKDSHADNGEKNFNGLNQEIHLSDEKKKRNSGDTQEAAEMGMGR